MKKFFRLRQFTSNTCWIVFSILLALWTTVLWVQEDPWAIQQAERELSKLLSSLYSCQVQGSITRIRLFRGHLLMKNVHAEGDGWHWDAPRLAIAWVWTDLLKTHSMLKLTLVFDQAVMHSHLNPKAATIQDALPIMSHIQKWLEPAKFAIPIAISSCTLQKTTLHVFEQGTCPYAPKQRRAPPAHPEPVEGCNSKRAEQGYSGTSHFFLSTFETPGAWETVIGITDAVSYQNGAPLGSIRNGQVTWLVPSDKAKAPTIKAELRATTPHYLPGTYAIKLDWQDRLWTGTIQQHAGSLQAKGTLGKDDLQITGTFPLSALTKLLPALKTYPAQGNAHVSATVPIPVTGAAWGKNADADIRISQLQIAGYPVPDISFKVHKRHTKITGAITITGILDVSKLQTTLHAAISGPFGVLTNLLPTARIYPVQGTLQIATTLPAGSNLAAWGNNVDAQASTSQVQIAGYALPDAALQFQKHDKKITGSLESHQKFPGFQTSLTFANNSLEGHLSLQAPPSLKIPGVQIPAGSGPIRTTWQLDGSWNGGIVTVTLPTTIELPGIKIHDGACTIRATWQPEVTAAGNFSARVALAPTRNLPAHPTCPPEPWRRGKPVEGFERAREDHSAPPPAVPVSGTYQISPEMVHIAGSWDKTPIAIQLALKPGVTPTDIPDKLMKQHKIALSGTLDGQFKASVQLDLLAPLAQAYGIVLNQASGKPGRLATTGTRLPDGTLKLRWALEQCRIYMPFIQTVIRQAGGLALLDLRRRELVSKDLRVQLARGEITASRARITLDDQWALQTAYLPIQIKNYFVSWKNHAWTQFSGLVRLEYVAEQAPLVHAMLVLDRTYLNENLLSAEFRRALVRTLPLVGSQEGPGKELPDWLRSCKFDLSCSTKTPIEMKTPFWDAQVQAGITCTGNAANPVWGGEAHFVEGSLAFPYRPLFITRGSLKLDPHNMQDPTIILVARNTIKKYAVELQLSGTAQAPVVEFDSSPPLDREEILTLLLSGSEDGALGIAVPRVLMENVEQLLIGSSETASWTRRYLGTLFSPLKYVKIIPRFTDQKGRGGLKGTVTVEFNDRLRGSVEKNFSLPEDVMVQGEYDLTDDTALRVLRDSRGDWGGEVEMRWKW